MSGITSVCFRSVFFAPRLMLRMVDLRLPRRHRCDHVRSRSDVSMPDPEKSAPMDGPLAASVLPLSQSQIEAQDE